MRIGILKKCPSVFEKENDVYSAEKNTAKLEYSVEEGKIEKGHLIIKDEIYKRIKDLVLGNLALWELDLEGNIQPIPEVSNKEWAEIKRAIKGEKLSEDSKKGQDLKKLIVEVKENIIKNLSKNNLQINDLNPELWKGAKSWEEKLEGLEDSEEQIANFEKKMIEEMKAVTDRKSIRVQPTENGNATLWLISIMVIGLLLVLFSLIYKFRKRNK